jgi:succinoglycan biosynthesis protein ExoO/succinoglycan biosynthesis protein ExoU
MSPVAESGLPSLSVIIPTFNCEAYLSDAIASVRHQEWPGVQVIVVDDGSTDGTAALLAPLAEREELIFLQRQNGGPSAARNAGLDAATGTLVAFLDADDRWAPGSFRALWQEMRDTPGTRWSFTDVVRAYPDRDEPRPGPYPEGDPLEAILRDNFVQRGGLFARSLLLEIGRFDESFRIFEDWDLYIRLFRAGARGAYLPGPWYRYTVREDSITRDYTLLVDSRSRLVAKHHRELAERGDRTLRAIYAHQLWKLAREYHYRLHRAGPALRCAIASLRWNFAPGKLVRAAGARRGNG